MTSRGGRICFGSSATSCEQANPQVTSRGTRARAKRKTSCPRHEVGRCTRIIFFISTTRAAILTKRSRRVPNWAMRHIDRFGIEARRPHISQ